MNSALEFAKQGASGLILHYLGDAETAQEVQTLTAEVEALGAHAIAVPGDIAALETSKQVRTFMVGK